MDERILISGADALGIDLSKEAAGRMISYGERLLQKNKSVNLTAIVDEDEFIVKHLLDSLTAAVLPEINGKVADIGTGGGFPGTVIKIIRPDCVMTLIDSTKKKLSATAEICNTLDIPVKIIHARAEDMGRKLLRNHFDTVVARAVAPLPQLLEYCLPLTKEGGVFIAMKGPEGENELKISDSAIKMLGAVTERVEPRILPGGIERRLIIFRKISETPPGYPRAGKAIQQNPLTNE